MQEIKKYIGMLGLNAEDKVTGFKGVVTQVGFDLYGCIQLVLMPSVDKDKKPVDGKWFDTNRLKVTGKTPVVELPDCDLSNIQMLGLRAEDKVTGFEGVISSVVYSLYGDHYVSLSPPVGDDGKPSTGKSFDVVRVSATTTEPVMSVPDYDNQEVAKGDHGPAEKPPLDRPTL